MNVSFNFTHEVRPFSATRTIAELARVECWSLPLYAPSMEGLGFSSSSSVDVGDVDAPPAPPTSSMNAENESINLKSATKTAGSLARARTPSRRSMWISFSVSRSSSASPTSPSSIMAIMKGRIRASIRRRARGSSHFANGDSVPLYTAASASVRRDWPVHGCMHSDMNMREREGTLPCHSVIKAGLNGRC